MTYSREKQIGQFLRIEFSRIIFLSKGAQRIPHYFAWIGVAAGFNFLKNELLEILSECHLHDQIFRCRRADVNRAYADVVG